MQTVSTALEVFACWSDRGTGSGIRLTSSSHLICCQRTWRNACHVVAVVVTARRARGVPGKLRSQAWLHLAEQRRLLGCR